jgi:hypothetical protein
MFFGIITFITALCISAVAIYYSVAGLVAIFAAAAIPIMIMGGVLEVGKLVTAVWLHRYWSRAVWWMKGYLSVAVLVLMFITSMGIFGFLSKAHIEQTAMSTEQVALIDTLNDKEARSEAKITRWSSEMDKLMKGEDVRVDSLIDREQDALKDLYAQIEKEKNNARADADKQIQLQNDRLQQAQDRKEADIKAAQDRYEGAFSKTGLDKAIEQAKANELSVASSAQKEIRNINAKLNEKLTSIDTKYANDITAINDRIQTLRGQANNKTVDIDSRITELEGFIDTEQKVIDTVREEKLVYEKTYRKLEAEVGPIKYIAEFIYGDRADTNLLEEAVRWVIIVIIFVFDPLAVLLLIASQYTFNWYREDKGNSLPPKPEDTEPELEPEPEPEGPKDGEQDVTEPTTTTDDDLGDVVPESDTTNTDESNNRMESTEVSTNEAEQIVEAVSNLEKWNEWVDAANAEAEKEIPNTRNRIFYKEELDKESELQKKRTYITKDKNKQVRKQTKDTPLQK